MNKTSVFKSQQGRAAIMEWYDSQVQKLSVQTESKMIETFAGQTHVLVAGPQEAPPVVVLHGNNMNAATMGDVISTLADTYRIYALDIIGMPGKSAETRLPHIDRSYAQWLLESLDQLGVKQAIFLGFSFGGWIILNLAALAPERITKAIFLDSGGFTQFTMKSKLKGGLAAMMYMWFPGKNTLKFAVDDTFYGRGCEPDPDLAEFIGLTYRHLTFNLEFVKHGVPLVSKKELSAFSSPCMVVYGEHDLFFDAKKSIATAKQILPNLQIANILKGQGHIFERNMSEQMCMEVREFLKKPV
jgi:2-hydroxy-6-oxonona-2,4-dienedioate hydrolase